MLRSRRVLRAAAADRTAGTFMDGGVLVDGEKIAAVLPAGALPTDVRVVDVGERVVLPGLVDTHAHINEPGRTDWEGFATATAAAAAGGITSIVDMPLNSIPATVSVAALREKQAAAAGACAIDYGFWGGVIPGNSDALAPLVAAGARGFKAFLIESGVDEFPCVSEADLRPAMAILATLGVPLLVHAEVPSLAAPEPTPQARDYHDYLMSRPAAWENDAVAMLIRLCRDTGCPVHVVHLSSAGALPLIAQARADGLALSAETCPHYLVFAAEDIADGATHFKCAPPIRERHNRELLWQGLAAEHIEFIVSDHSPCTPALKHLERGDFAAAWGGIASLQFGLSVLWTHAQARGVTLEQLVSWMSGRTARFAGLQERKGGIAPGRDADLVVFDPDATWTITPAMIRHRHKVTPYAGMACRGRVDMTFLRGEQIYGDGVLTQASRGVAL